MALVDPPAPNNAGKCCACCKYLYTVAQWIGTCFADVIACLTSNKEALALIQEKLDKEIEPKCSSLGEYCNPTQLPCRFVGLQWRQQNANHPVQQFNLLSGDGTEVLATYDFGFGLGSTAPSQADIDAFADSIAAQLGLQYAIGSAVFSIPLVTFKRITFALCPADDIPLGGESESAINWIQGGSNSYNPKGQLEGSPWNTQFIDVNGNPLENLGGWDGGDPGSTAVQLTVEDKYAVYECEGLIKAWMSYEDPGLEAVENGTAITPVLQGSSLEELNLQTCTT